MKRLLTVMLLTLSWALMWADSPLTSTDFAKCYEDQSMVKMAQNLSDDSDVGIPVSMLNLSSGVRDFPSGVTMPTFSAHCSALSDCEAVMAILPSGRRREILPPLVVVRNWR